MKISIGGGAWREVEEVRILYKDLIGTDVRGKEMDAALVLKCTSEGIVCDVLDENGDMIDTKWETAQDILEETQFD